MPDLTIETRAICSKFAERMQYRLAVTSFDYEDEAGCWWDEEYGREQKEEGVCPECGAPTTYIRVAV